MLFPIYPSANDEFKNKSVRIFCETETRTKIDLPFWIDIKIGNQEYCMTLLRKFRYVIDETNIAIIFYTNSQFVESVRSFYIRLKCRGVIIAIGFYGDAKSGIEG